MDQETVKTTFWAQVEPVWYQWQPDRLARIQVSRVTQRKPRVPLPRCVLVKLTLTVPVHAFVPPELTAEIEVGEGQFERVAVVAAEPAWDNEVPHAE